MGRADAQSFLRNFTSRMAGAEAVAGFAKGLAPLTAVEVARRALDSSVQPTADELEAAVKSIGTAK